MFDFLIHWAVVVFGSMLNPFSVIRLGLSGPSDDPNKE